MKDHTNHRKPNRSVRVIGVHVGGVSTQKTAIVRARCSLSTIFSGITEKNAHDLVCERIQNSLDVCERSLPGNSFDSNAAPSQNSPLFWEAFSTELGPTASKDADTRLLETISDFGGAEIFCLDAPLTFPSCTPCQRACPGVFACPEPPVQQMNKLWQDEKDSEGKRLKMPLPHTERFFEAYARRKYEHPSMAGSFDIENALSSNKAPLTARAHHIARRLRASFPNALIVETHPWLAALGWSLHCGFKLNDLREFRNPEAGRVLRAGLLKKLELSRIAMRSAACVEDLFVELYGHAEIFAAAMAAMSGWGLVNGLCDIQPAFLKQEITDPLQGWALVPRELATYGWGH